MWHIPCCNLLLIWLNRDMRNCLSSGDLPLFKLLLHLPSHPLYIPSRFPQVVLSGAPLCSLPVSTASWRCHTDCRAPGEAFPIITRSEGLPPMSQKLFHFSEIHVMLLVLLSWCSLGIPGCWFGSPTESSTCVCAHL